MSQAVFSNGCVCKVPPDSFHLIFFTSQFSSLVLGIHRTWCYKPHAVLHSKGNEEKLCLCQYSDKTSGENVTRVKGKQHLIVAGDINLLSVSDTLTLNRICLTFYICTCNQIQVCCDFNGENG